MGKCEYYYRYKGYTKPFDFRDDVLSLNPLRVELGPVYENEVRLNRDEGPKSIPVARELTFDIDMDQYDYIRTCCQGKGVCKKCWVFLKAGQEVLSALLSTCFGFSHILWVFSGRRGIHAWVCDKSAYSMPSYMRRSVASFLQFTETSLLSNYLVKQQLITRADYKPLQCHN